jgi:hypothetical protein
MNAKKTTPTKTTKTEDQKPVKKFNYLPFIILAVVIAALSVSRVSIDTPEAAGKLFCAADGKPFLAKRLFTPELKAAWDEAEAKNKAWAKANPGQKPPFGDGIPLAGFPDSAPVCEIAKPTDKHVEIHYKFPEDAKNNWTDRLVLKQVGGNYMVDDIQFAPRGTLRGKLKAAF